MSSVLVPKGDRQWDYEHAKEVISEWFSSGLGAVDFARERQVSVFKLWNWRAKLRKIGFAPFGPAARRASVDQSSCGDFSPVRLIDSSPLPWVFELALPNGAVIKCGAGFDTKTLASVIGLVSKC